VLSVLIPARNERQNIVDCIHSVSWCDEIVVVDSASNDGTSELAAAAGARIVDFKWNGQHPKKKNWALQNVSWKNDWLLILDADERVRPELAAEIQRELLQPRADGYFINRRFVFLGKWIKHCGYYPSWNLRLFRHRKGRYEKLHSGDTASGDNEVHEHVVLDGCSAYLKEDMVHNAYPDIQTWIDKHNRYSNWEAEIEVRGKENCNISHVTGRHLAQRRWLRTCSRHVPFRPALRFIYSYVLKHGFLDGYHGYMLCRLLAAYEMVSVFKAHELRGKMLADRNPSKLIQ
jgi:glycosyltransferase involved in cell wall biosynthesis